MKLFIDTDSGELPKEEVTLGAIDYWEKTGNKIVLCGNKNEIEKILKQNKIRRDPETLSMLTASEKISMEDEPRNAIRRKKQSAIVLGIKALTKQENSNSAFITPGNTGAVFLAARRKLRIKEISRPGLAILYPDISGKEHLLLDVGANTECQPEHLLRFGHLGKIYMESLLNRQNPTIALVNMGTEEYKGTKLIKHTHERFKEKNLNYIGFIEPKLLSGNILEAGDNNIPDVIVCNGFTGNIIIKSYEDGGKSTLGIFKVRKKRLQNARLSLSKLINATRLRLGGLLLKHDFNEVKRMMKAAYHGGAVLLGVNKVVIVCHGQAGRKDIESACLKAEQCLRDNLIGKIKEGVKNMEVKKTN